MIASAISNCFSGRRCIGILTAGGDCLGLNAAIRAITKMAMGEYGMKVIGIQDGFRGLVENRMFPLDDARVGRILTLGGTLLGTSRDKPHKMGVGSKLIDMTPAAVENARRSHAVRPSAVHAVGGEGSGDGGRGQYNIMVAFRNGHCEPVPLEQVAGQHKIVSRTMRWCWRREGRTRAWGTADGSYLPPPQLTVSSALLTSNAVRGFTPAPPFPPASIALAPVEMGSYSGIGDCVVRGTGKGGLIMDLYIIRHGDAGQRSGLSAEKDAQRELSAEGRDETARVAKGLKALKCRPEVIATSPLARAYQTAEILAEVLNGRRAVDTCQFLSPGGDPAALVRWLRASNVDCAMVVGHMPDLAILASTLLVNDSRADIAFKKSGVCRISFDAMPRAGAGCLEWLMQPKHLRAFAKRGKG